MNLETGNPNWEINLDSYIGIDGTDMIERSYTSTFPNRLVVIQRDITDPTIQRRIVYRGEDDSSPLSAIHILYRGEQDKTGARLVLLPRVDRFFFFVSFPNLIPDIAAKTAMPETTTSAISGIYIAGQLRELTIQTLPSPTNDHLWHSNLDEIIASLPYYIESREVIERIAVTAEREFQTFLDQEGLLKNDPIVEEALSLVVRVYSRLLQQVSPETFLATVNLLKSIGWDFALAQSLIDLAINSFHYRDTKDAISKACVEYTNHEMPGEDRIALYLLRRMISDLLRSKATESNQSIKLIRIEETNKFSAEASDIPDRTNEISIGISDTLISLEDYQINLFLDHTTGILHIYTMRRSGESLIPVWIDGRIPLSIDYDKVMQIGLNRQANFRELKKLVPILPPHAIV